MVTAQVEGVRLVSLRDQDFGRLSLENVASYCAKEVIHLKPKRTVYMQGEQRVRYGARQKIQYEMNRHT